MPIKQFIDGDYFIDWIIPTTLRYVPFASPRLASKSKTHVLPINIDLDNIAPVPNLLTERAVQ